MTTQLELGGFVTGVPVLFGAEGASWTENTYRWNGLDATDPYTTGFPLIDPDLDAISEFRVLSAAKPATSFGSGVEPHLGHAAAATATSWRCPAVLFRKFIAK